MPKDGGAFERIMSSKSRSERLIANPDIDRQAPGLRSASKRLPLSAAASAMTIAGDGVSGGFA